MSLMERRVGVADKDKDKEDGPSPSNKGSQFSKDGSKTTVVTPWGSGGDGSVAGLSNIRPLLGRSSTVFAIVVLFILCYILPSRLRALVENAILTERSEHDRGIELANAAQASKQRFCDAVSLKQQNISSRANVNIVAGSFSKGVVSARAQPPHRRLEGIGSSDMSKVVQLLDTYRAGHHAAYLDGVQDKNLCKRKFVVASYACPAQLGERVHEFLNAYAGAVITNRTLLWRYCSRKGCKTAGNDQATCDGLLQRLPWIPSADSIFDRLEKGGCPVDTERLDESPLVPMARHASTSESLTACCRVDAIQDRVIDFGVLERRDLLSLAMAGARLSSEKAARATMLFRAGEEAAYGALFRSAFSFSPRGSSSPPSSSSSSCSPPLLLLLLLLLSPPHHPSSLTSPAPSLSPSEYKHEYKQCCCTTRSRPPTFTTRTAPSSRGQASRPPTPQRQQSALRARPAKAQAAMAVTEERGEGEGEAGGTRRREQGRAARDRDRRGATPPETEIETEIEGGAG